MLTLRPYQQAAIEAVYRYFEREEGNPLLVLPTGTGKSMVIAELCRRALGDYPDTRILILAHVRELLEQNEQELGASGRTLRSGSAPPGCAAASSMPRSCWPASSRSTPAPGRCSAAIWR